MTGVQTCALPIYVGERLGQELLVDATQVGHLALAVAVDVHGAVWPGRNERGELELNTNPRSRCLGLDDSWLALNL